MFGFTLQEHDEYLSETLTQLRCHGMTLNDGKCVYRTSRLQFLGRMLSPEGISPLPATLEAIANAPVPHDKKSLRSFMGLTNFYRSFVPDIASLSSSLYELLKENVPFDWTLLHQEHFELLKSALADYVPLAFFDTNITTPTFLTTDASGYGISAVLSQKSSENDMERPIFFLSRKLSENERSYSASEKEFLAVLWACERLHQFLYGRPFTIRTDHQCLKQLLLNGFEGGSAPCRVIRWSTKLLQYNFMVQYIPGKDNYVADALSRVPQDTKESHQELFSVTLDRGNATPLLHQELKRETDSDAKLQVVSGFIRNEWPDRISKVPEEIRQFWNVRHELSYVDGIVTRNDKYVVPVALRENLISLAHEGHQGMSKTKSRIREFYWWPNLNSEVETVIKSCTCCHEIPREAPVQVPSYVTRPWHQIAIDIKGPLYDGMNRPTYIIVLAC